jgi:hypothetical protein
MAKRDKLSGIILGTDVLRVGIEENGVKNPCVSNEPFRVEAIMKLEIAEQIVRWAGAAGLLAFVIVAFGGIFSMRKRPRGRTEGKFARFLRWPMIFLILALDTAGCVLLWIPIPLEFPIALR